MSNVLDMDHGEQTWRDYSQGTQGKRVVTTDAPVLIRLAKTGQAMS